MKVICISFSIYFFVVSLHSIAVAVLPKKRAKRVGNFFLAAIKILPLSDIIRSIAKWNRSNEKVDDGNLDDKKK